MARSFTATLIMGRAKKAGDFVNDTSIPDADWLEWISASYAWLWALLADAGMLPWSTDTIAADGTKDYALPAGFYRSLLVQYQYQTGYWADLKWIQPAELHRYDRPNGSQAEGWYNDGTNLILLPAPPSGQSYRHIYYAAAADITSGATSIDGVAGWEEMIVLDCAIKARMKEETDTSDLMQKLGLYLERIEKERSAREMTATHRALGLFEDEQGRFDPADWRYWSGGS